MLNRYQGDPLLSIDENGYDIPFYGGQPVMDRGYINEILLSLFIRKGYILSKLIGAEGLEGSGFLDACSMPLTISNINIIRQSIEKAITIPGDVEVFVNNPSGSRLEILII